MLISSELAVGQSPSATANHARLEYNNDLFTIAWCDTVPEGGTGVPFFNRGVCKDFSLSYFVKEAVQRPVISKQSRSPVMSTRKRLLQVSGNVLYDVNYRSRIDTPYAESDIYQHTVQTRIDAVYNEDYPFRVYITSRFGNSNFLRKYTDFNIHFNQADFRRLFKDRAIKALENCVHSKFAKLDSLKREIERTKTFVDRVALKVKQFDNSQRVVEAKELAMLQTSQNLTEDTFSIEDNDFEFESGYFNKGKFSSISNPKLRSSAPVGTVPANTDPYKQQGNITEMRSEYDSLRLKLSDLETTYKGMQGASLATLQELKGELDKPGELSGLARKLKDLNIPDSILPKGFSKLSAIQSVNIGRFVADYSELSLKNISITGFQAELNPRYYYAVAIGKVDYRYRDYLVPNNAKSRQHVALVRVGKGNRFGNHVIFSYYTGRRQFYNSSISTLDSSNIPQYNLAGLSVEFYYKLSRLVSVIGEIGKSTIPYYSRDSLQKSRWMNSITDFSNRHNEAYSIKFLSYFPKTSTRVTANVRYTGANFQSFSTFTTGAAQMKWGARIDQAFLRKKVSIMSSIQQNEYHNPFILTTYKSNALLASVQANLRITKWPILSVGYYPSYQLVKVSSDEFTESRYYTLSASATHTYRLGSPTMTSYLVYSQFYNSSGDSGLIYYNSKNILLSNNLLLSKVSVSVNSSVSINNEYTLYTLESGLQLFINKSIAVGGGAKMIKSSLIEDIQWGYNGSMTIKISKLGDFQVQIDKGFIPNYNRQLVDNKMGRLTYLKTF